jgi:hypothetical protein
MKDPDVAHGMLQYATAQWVALNKQARLASWNVAVRNKQARLASTDCVSLLPTSYAANTAPSLGAVKLYWVKTESSPYLPA